MPTKRSMAEWGVRGALAVTAVVAGYVTVSHTMAQGMRRTDPARAYSLAPYDGRFTGALAQQRLGEGLSGAASIAAVETLAQRALRQDPTVVSGVASLGLVRLQQGNAAAAGRLLAYAERLSRRDLPTQLWAIEDAVARNDPAGALRHYDIALRTSKQAPELLFPILASAIADPDVRNALIAFLRRKPQWTAAFIGYVAGSDADPAAVSRLFLDLQRNGLSISPDATAVIINRLIAADAIGTAWNHYARARGVTDRQTARDPQFRARFSIPAVFDWNPVNDDAIITSIDGSDAQDGGFHFAVSSGSGGMMLHQLQQFPVGRYRIEGKSADIDQPDASLPYWSLTCESGREVGRVVVPASRQAGGRFTGTFDVPSGCPVQRLALVARSTDAVDGVAGTIRWVRLSPLR